MPDRPSPTATTTATTAVGTLSRRSLLTYAGLGTVAAAGVTLLPAVTDAAGAATLTDTPEQELGPFYVADGLVRSDVTAGEAGIPLRLSITVTDSTTGGPLVGAAVDIWQANALGVYSDEQSEGTLGETYLRGIQLTDGNGKVTFTSIVPGWYSGRTMHIHLRIYTGGTVSGSTYSYPTATLVHTGQMFFADDISTAVAATSPYSTNTTVRTLNSADRPYTQQGGNTQVLTMTGSTTGGYTGAIGIVVAGGGGTGTSSPAATSLTLTTSSTRLSAGAPLTVSGTLTDTATGKGLADQDVSVVGTLANGAAYSTVVETDDGGSWTLAFPPMATATYQASYLGSSTYAAATSATTTVTVDARIIVGHVSPKAPAARPITASGTVRPAAAGTTVTIAQLVRGTQRPVATATTDAQGGWTARWYMGTGQHHVVATVPATSITGAGTSRTLTIVRS